MQQIVFLGIFAFIIYAVYQNASRTTVLSNWHQLLLTQFSSYEFYITVQNLIAAKELPGIEFYRITYKQGGLLSPEREYMRIQYLNYVFDVCAAPFAKEFFVSYWHAELSNRIVDFFQSKIRTNISGYRGRRKTYFELDTENMLKESVKECIHIAVQQMTEPKGIRIPEGMAITG